MQDVHRTRLYQVAEQEFQKKNWTLNLLVALLSSLLFISEDIRPGTNIDISPGSNS